jgi:RNA polymerase-binding transcription factor DksA
MTRMTVDSPLPTRDDRQVIAERLAEDHDRITERIAALERQIAELVESGRETNIDDEHDPDGATIGFERAQAQALLDRARTDLGNVDEARDRLADDPSFGTCLECGNPIGVERLLARPSTTTCIDCAR